MKRFIRQSVAASICFIILGATACFYNNMDEARINALKKIDQKMPPVQAGDWLAAHREEGQTFAAYKVNKPVRISGTQNTIYLMPIGVFSPLEDTLIADTQKYLSIYFDLKIIVLPAISDAVIPKNYRRINGYTEKEQLMTSYILDSLALTKSPKNAIITMAITNKDLYPSDAWNFVFGQSYIYKRACVSSFDRYKTGKLAPDNYTKTLERLIKTASHEISHAFSIRHCINAVCVMNGSNNMDESDSRPNNPCSVCLRKLQWNLGFDVKQRAEKIENYFLKHQLFDDYGVASQMLTQIETVD